MELISHEDCDTAIRIELCSAKYKLISYEVKPLTGFGRFSQCFQLEAEVCLDTGESQKVNFFVKQQSKKAEKLGLGVKEETFYSTWLEAIDSTVSRLAPNHYVIQHSRYIIMEDLTKKGFRHCTKQGIAECQLVVDKIAALHAAFLQLERQHHPPADLSALYPGLLDEPLFVDDPGHEFYPSVRRSIVCLRTMLEQYTSNAVIVDRVMALLCQIPELLRPSKQFKNVFCHCDLNCYNLLFHYCGDGDGLPDEVCFVDYQMFRYLPPACDLLFFLQMSVDPIMRAHHSVALTQRYYDNLCARLTKVNLHAEDIMPRKEFFSSVYSMKPTACALAIFVTYSVHLPQHTPFSLDEERMEYHLKMFQENAFYRNKITDCFNELSGLVQVDRSTTRGDY